jgi:hypothetical protein
MLLSDFWNEVKKPFNAVMMVIALISLLVALFIWYLSQQVAQISYKIIQIPVVSSEGLNTTSPTSPFRVVDPQGAEIRTNVYAADITVWNSGDIDLGAEKIRRPLTISMSGDARIFDRGINRASDTVLDLNVSAISSNGTEIRWRYLDPNAGFRVRIIYGRAIITLIQQSVPYMPGRERDVTDERRGELETWLARVLWHYEDSGALGDEAAGAILTTLETCLPISERTLSHPLPDPRELVRMLESRWG